MKRPHVVIAWVLWAAFACVLGVSIYRGLDASSGEPITALDIMWATSIIGFPTTGAVIASRQPRSPLGWLFLVAPLLMMSGVGAGEEAETQALNGAYEAAGTWGWISNISMSAGTSLAGILALLIPNGKLPSPRWRIVVWIQVVIIAAWIVTAAFKPGRLASVPSSRVTNPYGIDGSAAMFNTLQAVLAPVFMALLLASLVSIFLRLRGASIEERQQLKWLGYGASVVATCVIVLSLSSVVAPFPQAISTLIVIVALLAIPVAIGLAVLKHGLYDIDVVINRTLVYAVLTAILAGAYVGLVFGLQALFAPVTAESDLAVAGSTLAVAGLFGPLRRRVQDFIDRRFYRRKFDIQRTLEEFGQGVRDEVELSALSRHLTDVVANTMQPVHVSLWLRTSQAGGSS